MLTNYGTTNASTTGVIGGVLVDEGTYFVVVLYSGDLYDHGANNAYDERSWCNSANSAVPNFKATLSLSQEFEVVDSKTFADAIYYGVDASATAT